MNKSQYRKLMENKWNLESVQAQNAFLAFDKSHPTIWNDFVAVVEKMLERGKPITLSAICESEKFACNRTWLRKENKKYNVMTMYANKLIRKEPKYDKLFPRNMKRVLIRKDKIRYRTVYEVLDFHRRYPDRYYLFCRVAILEIYRQRNAGLLYWSNLFGDIRKHGTIANDKVTRWYAHSFMVDYEGTVATANLKPLLTSYVPKGFRLPTRGKLPVVADVITAEKKRVAATPPPAPRPSLPAENSCLPLHENAVSPARIAELQKQLKRALFQNEEVLAKIKKLEKQRDEDLSNWAHEKELNIDRFKEVNASLRYVWEYLKTPFWERVKRMFGGQA